jgi:ubiquinone/menaquinone biosynthesis C-methylase UbiE/spore maturation protein CgeB
MANDRVNQLYRGRIFGETQQRICRERIHWMCSQVRGQHVLDLGCSEGMASLLLGQEGHQVVGVDINPAVLEAARQEFAEFPDFVRQNVRFELISAGRLPFDDASFDTVLMGEVLEHQTRSELLVAEARRVLRPEGIVVVTTPFGVFRDEDHRRTFYLSDFVALMASCFRTEDLHILGKYICYLGRVPGSPGADGNGISEARRLLQLSEEAFERAENTYLEQVDRTRGELEALRQKLTQLKTTSDAEHKERAALAAKLSVAERWHNGSLQFMRELRSMLTRNGALGDLARLSARTERILSAANTPADSAHAPDMLAEVLRDLVGSLESHLVTREQELVRLRETQQAELTRLQRELRTQSEAATTTARRELRAAVEQERTAAERRWKENLAAQVGPLKKERDKLAAELAGSRKTKANLDQDNRSLRERLRRQAAFIKAEQDLRSQQVRYQLGDAFVRAATNPIDLVCLPVRMMRLFFAGLRRRHERKLAAKAGKQLPAQTPSQAAQPTATGAPLKPAATPGAAKPDAAASGAAATAASAAPGTAPGAKVAGAPETASGAATSTTAANGAKTGAAPNAAKPAAETPGAAAAPKPTFKTIETPNRPPRLPVKIAAIMDEFTLACFKPECQLLLVKPDDWKQVLTAERPDCLLIESTWNGNGGAWRYQVAVPRKIEEGPLRALVEWCRSQNIPTVFWNKEDPPNFEQFINAAALCDHVFTTDANCIPQYQGRLGHQRVYPLPFAAQELIHNPVDTHRNLAGNVCFAGAYYAKRHEERQGDMDVLLKPALARGLHIFDRMHGTTDERYLFPAEYAAAIQGSLPYAQMLDAYKRYRVFLNVNSVKDSPTMFSRRVLELLACGTPVISTAALGIERLLGRECVALVETAQEAQQWLDLLLNNQDIADRMVLRAQRRIFTEHTYQQRLRTILETIGIPVPIQPRRVSVITCTNRPAKLENVIANYERQQFADKELVLVLNSDDFSLEAVRERLKTVANARAFQLPAERTLGACLNKAIDEIQHEYWTKFDDDNYYAEHFITDMMLPFLYTEASIVGKYTYYSYHEGPRCLALRYPGCEHQYVTLLSGSALIVDRKVNKELRFPELNRGEDTQFLRECVHLGFKLYSADRFNYVVRRSKRVEDHTWQISDAEFLRHCQIVSYTDDCRAHVEV